MKLKTGEVILGINNTGRKDKNGDELFSVLLSIVSEIGKRLKRREVCFDQIQADRGIEEINEMIARGEILPY
jgi:hypothetical protein